MWCSGWLRGQEASHEEDELGTLEVRKLADIILVASNPMDDMGALRRINWVIKGGVGKRPEELMAMALVCR